MKNIKTMTADDWSAAEPGELFQVTPERSEDFRTLTADGFVVLSAAPDTLILAVMRNEPRNLVTTGRLVNIGGVAGVAPIGNSATTVQVEEVHVRGSREALLDGALAILNTAMEVDPGFARQKYRAFGDLRARLEAND